MSLKPGDVFWDKNDSFPNEPAHPHIVICISDKKEIVYVVTSTNKKTTKKWALQREGVAEADSKTYIVAELANCQDLKQDSHIDCNGSWKKSEYVLTRRPLYQPPAGNGATPELVKKIIVGVLASKLTDPAIAAILNPPPPENGEEAEIAV